MSTPIPEKPQEKEPQIVYCSRSSIENKSDEITLPGSLNTLKEESEERSQVQEKKIADQEKTIANLRNQRDDTQLELDQTVKRLRAMERHKDQAQAALYEKDGLIDQLRSEIP
jgi:uncharacterized coiled-coil protein SlyX